MVLVIGFVVDDVIVVLENVDCYIKEGEFFFCVVIIGICEIVILVIVMMLMLGVVYVLIVLMGGITGLLFKEFVFILVGFVFVFGIVVLILLLMMCLKMFKVNEVLNKFELKVYYLLDCMMVCYECMLIVVMVYCFVVIVFVFIVFVSLLMLFKFILSEFVLLEDKGVIMLMGIGLLNVNFDYLVNMMDDVNKILFD